MVNVLWISVVFMFYIFIGIIISRIAGFIGLIIFNCFRKPGSS